MLPSKIVTSFSSKRIERQRYCLNSWLRMDLPIIGIQTEGESDLLKEHFPEVTFVETSEGGTLLGKPHLPLITELVKQATDSSILLINSDVSIEDTKKEFDRNWVIDELLCGIRLNHKRIGSPTTRRNAYGIDAFKILPQHIPYIENLGFTVGMPGWDYYIPYQLNKEKFPIRVSDSLILHLEHENDYTSEDIAKCVDILCNRYNHQRKHFTFAVQALTGRSGKTGVNTRPEKFNWRKL